ncbi:peptidylprolyl isomerase [Planctomycetota bacterium]|nr:peptidylprolyl isomerase [Planctomycetota bacterium]
MKRRTYIISVLLLCAATGVWTACNSSDNTPPAFEMSDEVKEMHRLYREINKREPINQTIIDVQYLVIEHRSDGQLGKNKKLSIGEAEQLSTELLAKAKGGYDFETMVMEENYRGFEVGEMAGHVRIVSTEEELKANPGSSLRSIYSPHFQATVFRLQPGEFCVVPYHNVGAQFGHYLVRRLPTGLLEGLVDESKLSVDERDMYARAHDVLKRDEITDNMVTVQHILIGHAMIKGDKKYLSRQSASKLAAEVLKKVDAGEDFETLVKEYSYDYTEANPTGEYTMYKTQPTIANDVDGSVARDTMVKHFSDVSYRLKVGEIGITLKSVPDGKYGFHIIKRMK